MKILLPLALAALLIGGCAKFPSNGTGGGGTRLIFTMRMDGPVNPNFVYIVALHPTPEDPPTTQGPIPVIGPPWGNGFVAGTVTHFVRWDTSQSPHFIIYKFTDQNLINFFELGVPVNVQEVQPGDREIHFEILLSQIAISDAEAASFKNLQVNFLTMDRVPQGNDPGGKVWDALGDGAQPDQVNEFINVPLRTSGVYDNRHYQNLEVQGDNPDPALDIVDFSVEVRL